MHTMNGKLFRFGFCEADSIILISNSNKTERIIN